LSQKEFQLKIDNIVDENIFKIITNPNAFVSLKWQDQRKTLVEIAQIPDDREIALGNTDLENLLNEVGNHKTIEEFTAQTKHSIKKAKEEIDNIPARIEELTRSLPVPIVEKNVIANIESLKKELDAIDEKIGNKMSQFDSVIEQRNSHQVHIQKVQSKINDIEFKIKEEAKTKASGKNPQELELNSLKKEFYSNQEDINNIKVRLTNLEGTIQQLERYRNDLRTQWAEVNARQFKLNPTDTTCNTCGQELQNSDSLQSELEYKFNTRKQTELKAIQEKGGGYKNDQELKEADLKKVTIQLAETQKTNNALELKIEELDTKVKASSNAIFNADNFITESLLSDEEYNNLKRDIAILQQLTFETPTEENTAEFKTEKQEIQDQIVKLNGYLQDNKRIGETNERIDELKTQESSQNHVIAQFERKLFLIEKFNKKKIDLLDQSVNKMFSLIKFKLFDIQINGGVKDTCEAMVNGVPFGNVNTASRINAGLDIIKTLCQYYKVLAPVFIDNKESVTKIIATDSQRICLEVSPDDKVLRIN
jgi:chromosome segregation ATPase